MTFPGAEKGPDAPGSKEKTTRSREGSRRLQQRLSSYPSGPGPLPEGGPGTPSVALEGFGAKGGGPGTGRYSGPGPPGFPSRLSFYGGFGKKKSGHQGQRESPAPITTKKNSCQGQKRVLTPLAAKKTSYQGRRRVLAPLATKKTGCRGQRIVLAPLGARKRRYQGRRRVLAPLATKKTCYQGL